MKLMKKVVLAGASLLMLGIFSGCSSSNEKKGDAKGDKEIEFWTISLQPTFNDYFNEVINNFEKENKGYKVVWKDYPYDTLKNKLLTSISSNDVPDIVNLNAEMALSMGSKAALSNADDYLSDNQKNSFFEGIYDAPKFKDQTLAVPWYTTCPVMFVNKSILEDAKMSAENLPTNFEDYIDWANELHEKSGKYATTAVPDVRDTLVTNGVKVLNDDHTKAVFNSSEAIEVLTDYKKMIEDGVAPKDASTIDAQVQMFASEQLGSVINGTTFINALKTAAPDVYENTLAVPVPYSHTLSSSMFLTVPEKSNNKDLAYKFVNYVTNAEEQLAFSKVANTLPSTKETVKDSFFTESNGSLEDDAKVASANSLDKANELALDVELFDEINKGIQNILLNGADVKSELNRTVDAVNEKLK